MREYIYGSEYSSSPDNYQCKAIDTIAGMVLDGGVLDTMHIAALGLPAFCPGPAAPANLVVHHASDMNQPVACGGVAVCPTDVTPGDDEAVIVIPRKWADEITDETVAMDAQEEFLQFQIESGRSTFGVYPPTRKPAHDLVLDHE